MIATSFAEPATDPTPPAPPATEAVATTDTGTVRKITANHGNLITTLRAEDMAALGIEVGQTFTLRIGESEYTARYGRLYEDVPVGEWVAVAKDAELIWIARRGENAAASAKVEVGAEVRVLPGKP
ncbi:MAG: SAM hydroxide adenosyltransferase [Verrucomicrobiota bacterium]